MRKPYSEQKMWTTACALERDTYEALVERAARRGSSISEVIREYIKKGLNEDERNHNPSEEGNSRGRE